MNYRLKPFRPVPVNGISGLFWAKGKIHDYWFIEKANFLTVPFVLRVRSARTYFFFFQEGTEGNLS
ncbi:hypothetical protein XI25_15255 [Paenibacillus sp. DMB20]|nr:hypothetical protein XI25_15255 [Paenibacillus sp. DMB20]